MDSYYDRKFVREMQRIFSFPRAPERVTQVPLDGDGAEYKTLIKKQWHQIGRDDWWNFLNDMCYVDELQQELFDFLFPCFLITWRDGLAARDYAPESESDLFKAIRKGNILEKMMDPARRELVEAWITDAFCSQVDTLNPEDIESTSKRNDCRDFFLYMFNAIGQVIPIVGPILKRIGDAKSPGRARYWLVLATGLCYPVDRAPWVAPWTPNEGGGGVYLTESHAALYDFGFMEVNMERYREFLTIERLRSLLEEAAQGDLMEHERGHVLACLHRIDFNHLGVKARLEWYLHSLSLPDLGGIQDEPTFFAD